MQKSAPPFESSDSKHSTGQHHPSFEIKLRPSNCSVNHATSVITELSNPHFSSASESNAVNSPSSTTVNPSLPDSPAKAACSLLGHRVDHTTIVGSNDTACTRCGAAILNRNEKVSRLAHTLSCFFGSHHYLPVAQRAGHNEYVCERCGHPLLFELARDPYSRHRKFNKRVNYGCGIFGHRVHVVATGLETIEYACRCGHSFIKEEKGLNVVRHPLKCVMMGHLVAINQMRGGWAEYRCLRCGHPFCYKLATAG